ncbi:hypothetical protein ACEPAH_7989 [Sanghuangporus vaninii]
MSDLVQLPSGHKVELVLRSQPASASSQLAILLHPWSWLGGNMNDPVLHLLEEHLFERGYHVLRYNSRGVGRSKGWPSLTGSQEVQDLREVVQWALEKVLNTQHLLLIGYSHGSLITSQHPPLFTSSEIKTSHILLSYPLGPRAWLTLFRSKSYDEALNTLARDPKGRILIIYGDRDEFTGVESYREWSDKLEILGKEDLNVNSNRNASAGRVRVSCIEGGSHFWAQNPNVAEEMLNVVQRWLDGR